MTTCGEAFNSVPSHPSGTLNHIFLCGGISDWMWKHLAGLTPTSPGFATVQVAPKVYPSVGPQSLVSEFLSPRGAITSRWNISHTGDRVAIAVSLPVGIQSATIVVPKPFGPSHAGPPTTICAIAHENMDLFLSCPGGFITSIDFASFGTPDTAGDCGKWKALNCTSDPAKTIEMLAVACVHKQSCSFNFSSGGGHNVFGPDPCNGVVKQMAARASCSSSDELANHTATAVISNAADGSVVWDGGKLVAPVPPGIRSAQDNGAGGVAIEVANGDFAFLSTAPKPNGAVPVVR